MRSGFAAFVLGGLLIAFSPLALADRINLADLTAIENAKQAEQIVKEYKGETL